MDGFAFASEVRRRSSDDRTRPVLIAITGYGSQADRERAQRVGFDALITKPVDVATLETLIASEEAGGGTPTAGSRTTS